MSKKFASSNGVSIEYYLLNNEMSGIPLVIIPGAVVGAVDVYDAVKDHVKYPTIIISLRGRGESSKPETGYSLDDQVSDIECVINSEKLNAVCIMGHSNGAGIAAKYAIMHQDIVKGLVLVDYLPGYPAFSTEWAEYVKAKMPGVNENLLNGLAKESVKQYFLDDIVSSSQRVLLLKADGEDSLLKTEVAEKIKNSLPNCEYRIINNCGHEMFSDNPKEVFEEVKKFMEMV